MKIRLVKEAMQLTRRGFILLMFAGILITGCQSAKEKSGQTLNPNGRNDEWGFTGYGGGGAMFWPAVSPHDPDYAYLACDMTGSFVTYNGGKSWRMFSLLGPVKYFVLDPVDPDVAYHQLPHQVEKLVQHFAPYPHCVYLLNFRLFRLAGEFFQDGLLQALFLWLLDVLEPNALHSGDLEDGFCKRHLRFSSGINDLH